MNEQATIRQGRQERVTADATWALANSRHLVASAAAKTVGHLWFGLGFVTSENNVRHAEVGPFSGIFRLPLLDAAQLGNALILAAVNAERKPLCSTGVVYWAGERVVDRPDGGLVGASASGASAAPTP